MEKEDKIINVDVTTLHENVESYYSDGDIIIFDNIAEIVTKNAFELDLVLLVFCSDGKMQLSMNGMNYSAGKGDLIIGMPKTLCENIMVSPDFKCSVMGLSYKALQYNMNTNHNVWNVHMFIAQNPIIHLKDDDFHERELYFALISEKLKKSDRLYYRDTMRSLFQCMYYELMTIVTPLLKTTTMNGNLKQGELLCKKFFELVVQNEGRERSVAKFATMLCVTPKYLSSSVKLASGKTALEWIHQVTIESIMRQLKYTDKSIKEIAEYMGFPNLSFFGKFVKGHIGMSPTEYRRQL